MSDVDTGGTVSEGEALADFSKSEKRTLTEFAEKVEYIKEKHNKERMLYENQHKTFREKYTKEIQWYQEALALQKEYPSAILTTQQLQALAFIKPKLEAQIAELSHLEQSYIDTYERIKQQRQEAEQIITQQRRQRYLTLKARQKKKSRLDTTSAPPTPIHTTPTVPQTPDKSDLDNTVIETDKDKDKSPTIESTKVIDQERKQELYREIECLADQTQQLEHLFRLFETKEEKFQKTVQGKEYFEYRYAQFQFDIYHTLLKRNNRKDILKGQREDFDIEPETEYSDDGYSPVSPQDDYEIRYNIGPFLRRSRTRQKVDRPHLSGDSSDSDHSPAHKPKPRVSLAQYFCSDSDTEDMAVPIKWSLKDLP